MDSSLERYLNDHLAGSCGAVQLLEDLSENQEQQPESDFFLDLKQKVEADQDILRDLLSRVGLGESATLQVIGNLTERASQLKLRWEGLNPGELGMFEALEMLSLGIHGKLGLWNMLAAISPGVPEWDGIDFRKLAAEATAQRDSVEARRLEAGARCLLSEERTFPAQALSS